MGVCARRIAAASAGIQASSLHAARGGAAAWRIPSPHAPPTRIRPLVTEKDVISTDRAPGPFQGAPYNQAIRVGELVFVAGQLGISHETGTLAGADVTTQTEQIMANLAAILEAAGSGLDRLVKTTVFLMDLGDFAAMNEVYARHVGDRPPARSTVQISGLPSGALVEIEAVAHV
jgi:2-iminobutanoate/2-iminopropanoate deaminase